MRRQRMERILGIGAALGLAAGIAWPRDPLAMNGAELYAGYCASCHGAKGAGDGPRAATNEKAPTDLTRLAELNGGEYPFDRVIAVLEHPNPRLTGMPRAGYLFRSLGQTPAKRKLLYRRLAEHIGTLQQVAPPESPEPAAEEPVPAEPPAAEPPNAEPLAPPPAEG